MKLKNPEGQVARWLEALASYDMKIEHRPGKAHQNADGLSQIPCRQCGRDDELDFETPKMSVNTLFEDDKQGTDVPSIISSQDADADISLVKSWVEKGERPPYNDIASGGYFLK